MVFFRFAFREVLTRPGRAVLTLLSIVIGVAAVVSVNVATTTTRRAYHEMFATVSGRAALEVVANGGGTFDEDVANQVQAVPGVRAAVPVIQRPALMFVKGRRVKLMAMGIDPAKDAVVRDYHLAAGELFDGANGILLEENFAKSLDVELDDELKLFAGQQGVQPVTVVGLLRVQGATSLQLAGLIFLPLRRAQSVFSARGRIDTIQVVLEETAGESKVSAEIERRLPVGLTVRRPANRTQQLEETLLSSEEGLRMATAFSLVLALFIILNTFLMNVGERRQKLAIMRAIGATRRQIVRLLVGESLVMGAVGTALGILVGVFGAHLLTRAIEKLLMVSLPALQITPLALGLAVLFGFGVSLLGAVIPAILAARVSPLEGMGAVSRADIAGPSNWIKLLGPGVCLLSGAVLAGVILGWITLELAVPSAIVLLLGAVLVMWPILGPLSSVVVWMFSPLLHTEARLAQRQILRHRVRTALTVGVLFVASATGIGLGNAMLDNVRDVKLWYHRALVGDFFIRAMMPDMATGLAADLPAALGAEIRAVAGITNIDTARFVEAQAAGQRVVVIAREFTSAAPVYFDLRGGDRDQVRRQILEGQVVIGTVLAQRTGLGVGDELPLETREGVKRLRIAGLTNEYMVGGLSVYMEREHAERLLHIQGIDAYLIQVDPGALADAQARLQKICDEHGVMLYSFADISRLIDGMIKGIDGCLWGILVLGFVVSAFGVVNTLTMNVLEQTRELGLLRIVAMTRWQVRKTILTQAAIIGGIGLAPGTLVGLGIAYLMNLATLPALGHPVEFVFHPFLLIGCFTGAFVMVVAAAWLPAERAARLELMKALQYE